MNNQRLVLATIIGALVQIAMVVAGHWIADIKSAFMFGGLGLSLIAGAIYTARSQGTWRSAAAGGVIAGGVSALLGIAVSFSLGDVPGSLLVLGTVGSMVTGLSGALGARALLPGLEARQGHIGRS
jgi:peptidoglycan/LPS O-acetylase OafA/YrhL